MVTPDEVMWFVGHLCVREGRLAVDDVESARFAAWRYMQTDDRCWSDLRELSLYRLTADAIRAAWQAGCVSESDLRGTDWPLWEKLQSCTNPEVVAALALVTPETQFVLDTYAPDITIRPKIRALDPDVALDGVLSPLSELDAQFCSARAAYLERKDRPWGVRISRRLPEEGRPFC